MDIKEIKNDVAFWQRLLRLGGYNPGAIDGICGKKTQAAAAQWDIEARQAKREYGEFDERTEGVLATLLPEAQKRMREWLLLVDDIAFRKGLQIKLIDGTRSYAEQDKLYAKRPRVTKAKGGYSWHNFGLAADFGVFCGKNYITDDKTYIPYGQLAREVKGLEWGGDWKSFVDIPHIQLNKFSSLAEARSIF